MTCNIVNYLANHQDSSWQLKEADDYYYIADDLAVAQSSISKICEINGCNICIAEEWDDRDCYIIFAQSAINYDYFGYAYFDPFPDRYGGGKSIIYLDGDDNFILNNNYNQIYDAVYARMERIADYHRYSWFSDWLFLSFYDTNTAFDRNHVYCRIIQDIHPNNLSGSINYDSTAKKIEFIARGLTQMGEEVLFYWIFDKYDNEGGLISESSCYDWEIPHKFQFL